MEKAKKQKKQMVLLKNHKSIPQESFKGWFIPPKILNKCKVKLFQIYFYEKQSILFFANNNESQWGAMLVPTDFKIYVFVF